MRALLLILLLAFLPAAQASPIRPTVRVALATGYVHDPDADAYLATDPVKPQPLVAKALAAFVTCIKAGGLWKTKATSLFLLASWDQAAGLTDLVRPGHVAIAVNAPAFVAFRGFQGVSGRRRHLLPRSRRSGGFGRERHVAEQRHAARSPASPRRRRSAR